MNLNIFPKQAEFRGINVKFGEMLNKSSANITSHFQIACLEKENVNDTERGERKRESKSSFFSITG